MSGSVEVVELVELLEVVEAPGVPGAVVGAAEPVDPVPAVPLGPPGPVGAPGEAVVGEPARAGAEVVVDPGGGTAAEAGVARVVSSVSTVRPARIAIGPRLAGDRAVLEIINVLVGRRSGGAQP